jgi:hypothetical protein
MEGYVITALVVTVPIILFPAAFIWYLNVAGTVAFLKDRAKAREAQKTAIPVRA